MQDNIDLKKIWLQQKVTPPDINELRQKLKQYRKKSFLKLLLSNTLLIATCCFIAFIWMYCQPQFISTKMGIVLVLLAMLVYMIAQNKQISVFKTLNENQSNSDYLQKLIAIKQLQKKMHTSMLSLYFILLLIGLCLYMYEYTQRMTLPWQIIAYVASIGWIAFVWFVERPRTIKKQQEKLDELINQSQAINDYLNEK